MTALSCCGREPSQRDVTREFQKVLRVEKEPDTKALGVSCPLKLPATSGLHDTSPSKKENTPELYIRDKDFELNLH